MQVNGGKMIDQNEFGFKTQAVPLAAEPKSGHADVAERCERAWSELKVTLDGGERVVKEEMRRFSARNRAAARRLGGLALSFAAGLAAGIAAVSLRRER
jgi:hypothetical protein